MTATAAGTPVREALQGASDALEAAGVDSPRLDAELLLCEAAGWERAQLAADPEAAVPAAAGRSMAAMVRRRLRREPLAYITGRKGFRGIELAVDPRALIPRPETELLVEVARELGPATALDVGTGSGAVALAVAAELPACELIATDTSPAALELARENAAALGLSDRIGFELGTLPEAKADPAEEAEFDVLLANLPYVRDAEWEALAPEIREYEPRGALLGGADGLDAIRDLLSDLDGRSIDAVALEVGLGQAAEVEALVRAAGFSAVESRRDLAGIERVVVGQ